MKKLFLSLVAIFALAATAQAEVKGIGKAKLFKNLGVSAEVGVHGPGVNLSTTLVHKHLYLMLGYNFPALEYNTDFDVSTGGVNSQIASINSKITEYNATYGKNVAPLTPLNSEESVDFTAQFKFISNFKAMIQYFPSANSGFHFTAGVMIGEDEFLHLKGQLSPAASALYRDYCDLMDNPEHVQLRNMAGLTTKESATFTLNDQTFEARRDGSIDLGLQVEKIKPYIGIGFGNAIPQDHRVGFQFELGTWLHGSPSFTGGRAATQAEMQNAEISTDDFDFSNLKVLPTMTFRITGRIF